MKYFLAKTLILISSIFSITSVQSQNVMYDGIFINNLNVINNKSKVVISGIFSDTLHLGKDTLISNGISSGVIFITDSTGRVLKSKAIKSRDYSSIKSSVFIGNSIISLVEAFNNVVVNTDTLKFNQLSYLLASHKLSDLTVSNYLLISGGQLFNKIFCQIADSVLISVEFNDSVMLNEKKYYNEGSNILVLKLDSLLNIGTFRIYNKEWAGLKYINTASINSKVAFYHYKKTLPNKLMIYLTASDTVIDSTLLTQENIGNLNALSYNIESKEFFLAFIDSGLNKGRIYVSNSYKQTQKTYTLKADYLHLFQSEMNNSGYYLINYTNTLYLDDSAIYSGSSDNTLLLKISMDTIEICALDYNMFGGAKIEDNLLIYYNFINNEDDHGTIFNDQSKTGSLLVRKNSKFKILYNNIRKDENYEYKLKYSQGTTVYPNPNHGEFHLQGENIQKVGIYDVAGRKVDFIFDRSENGLKVNIFNLSDGIYYVKYQIFGEVLTAAIIKSRN